MTQDLTKITTPFGLLDAETQEALRAHGGPYHRFNGKEWVTDDGSNFGGWITYRVKPQPPKPREWWVSVSKHGEAVTISKEYTNAVCFGHSAIRVREVLE